LNRSETTLGAETSSGRVASLDLIRGIAVLGILAINIAGFAGPIAATISPHLPNPGTRGDEIAFAVSLLLFEGKMRALFSLLFGASMLLFVERVEASGRDGQALQLRRLGWLALFGYLHFLLFWWGDILFTYAFAGFLALAFRFARPRTMVACALACFVLWHGLNAAADFGDVATESRAIAGTASPVERAEYQASQLLDQKRTASELAEYRKGFADQVMSKLGNQADWPVQMAVNSVGETLPLMLIGMALYLSGFFSGGWSSSLLKKLALWGTGSGSALTAAILVHAWRNGFPPVMMEEVIGYWAAIPHLLMALGYAAALVLLTPRLLDTALGRRICAAGRMAFSNYLGTTVVMTAIFYGWGLGLVGTIPDRWYWPFILLGWGLMLGWSRPWLNHFRQGPMEWIWRSLTEWRVLPMKR
jgi:uncharacterized protein